MRIKLNSTPQVDKPITNKSDHSKSVLVEKEAKLKSDPKAVPSQLSPNKQTKATKDPPQPKPIHVGTANESKKGSKTVGSDMNKHTEKMPKPSNDPHKFNRKALNLSEKDEVKKQGMKRFAKDDKGPPPKRPKFV